MKYFLAIFLILPSLLMAQMPNQTYGPVDTTTNGANYGTDTTTRLCPWLITHNVDIDTMVVCWKYVDAGDKIYGVIYSVDANGSPNTRLGRTADSSADAGKVKLTFASSVSLSERTVYAIGVEIIDGDASSHTVNYHRDTLRSKTYFQFTGYLEATWDTANDVVTNAAGMPWWNIIGQTTVNYDSTARDSSHTLTKGNYLEEYLISPLNHGTAAQLYLGRNNTGISGWHCRPVVSTENATETYIESFFADTLDWIDSAVFKIDSSGYNGVTSSDTFYLYALIPVFNESQSNWDIYSTGNNWATAGAGGSGTDHYALLIDKFVVGDADNGWYVFDHTNSLILALCDSLILNKWEFSGFLMTEKGGLQKNDNILLSSDDASPNEPVFQYWGQYLTQSAAGGATTNRHSNNDRHGAYRH